MRPPGKKKRDVLFIALESPAEAPKPEDEKRDPFPGISFDWEKQPSRRKLVKWLDKTGFKWKPRCAKNTMYITLYH